MDEFLILIIEPEWDEASVTEDDWKREAVLHAEFSQAVRDAGCEVRGGNALKGDAQSVRVRPGRNGAATLITDGPFAETKEILSGYYIVTAADIAQATRFAELCPTAGYNEVRPILDISEY